MTAARTLRLLRPLIGASLLGLAGIAAAAGPLQREYDGTARTLAKLKPGRPTDCISLTRTRSSRFLDRDTIAYRDTARRWYVNRTSSGCRFDLDTIVVTSNPVSQLCRGDILRLVDRGGGFPRGSCILGDFVPYTR